MRIVNATKKLNGLKCKVCNRAIVTGQYVLHHRVQGVFTSEADVVVHAECARGLLGAADGRMRVAPTPDERLARERQRILATGKVFA